MKCSLPATNFSFRKCLIETLLCCEIAYYVVVKGLHLQVGRGLSVPSLQGKYDNCLCLSLKRPNHMAKMAANLRSFLASTLLGGLTSFRNMIAFVDLLVFKVHCLASEPNVIALLCFAFFGTNPITILL